MNVLVMIAFFTLLLMLDCGHRKKPLPSSSPTPQTTPDKTASPTPKDSRSPDESMDRLRKLTPPFAEVLKIERVRVAEPISFVVEGKKQPTTDFLLIAIRLYDLMRFLGRDSGQDEIMLNDFPTQALGPLETNLVLIAPVSAEPLAESELWTRSSDIGQEKVPLNQMSNLRKLSRDDGPGRSVSLAAAVQAGRADLKVRTFANREELRRYAQGVVKNFK